MINEIKISDEYVIINYRRINLIKYIEDNDIKIRQEYLSLIEKINKSIHLQNNFVFKKLNLVDFFKSFEKNPYKDNFKLTLKLIAINEIVKNYDNHTIINKIINKKLKLALDILTTNKLIKKDKYIIKKLINFFKASLFLLFRIGFKKKLNIQYDNYIFTYSAFNKDGYPIHWSNLNKNYTGSINYIYFPTKVSLLSSNKKKNHTSVYEIVSNFILLKSYFIYIIIFFKNFNFNFCKSNNNIKNSIIYLLHSSFIKDSSSVNLLENIIFINFFDNFFDKYSKKKKYFIFMKIILGKK